MTEIHSSRSSAAQPDEVRLPPGVEASHASQMHREVALLDEVVDGRLEDQRRELARDADGLVEGIREFHRHDEIADAQGRHQRLAEAADVDDPLGVVETAQRRHWAAAKPVLAVIVVLDDPGPATLGDAQELQPLLDPHDRAEGPLAGGGDVDEARRRQLGVGQLPAMPADPEWSQSSAAGEKGALGTQISGLLHPDMVAVVHQDARDEVERGLGAGDDDHLIGQAVDPPRYADGAGDGLPQAGVPGEREVAQQVLVAAARVATSRLLQIENGNDALSGTPGWKLMTPALRGGCGGWRRSSGRAATAGRGGRAAGARRPGLGRSGSEPPRCPTPVRASR